MNKLIRYAVSDILFKTTSLLNFICHNNIINKIKLLKSKINNFQFLISMS